MRTLTVLGSGLMLGVLAAHGCAIKGVDPLHCAVNDGDAYCAERLDDGIRRYCQRGTDECYTGDSQYGCVEQRPADECYSPCGGRETIDENGECVIAEGSSSGTSSGGTNTDGSSGSSESTTTTGPMLCVSDDECTNPEAPLCTTTGECGTCDATDDPDAACAGLDPASPVCVGNACLQCTAAVPDACTGKTPVCDDASNTCIACTAHDQCGEAACNLYTGACLPADAVVHVGGPTPDFPSLSMAVASFDAEAEGTILVHPGMPSYDEAVLVGGGRVLAFLAADLGPGIEPPRWVQTSGSNPQLTVAAGTTVLMDGLQLSSNASATVPALLVNGGRAWVDRSRIVQNSGGGVVAQSNADLTLRNCFVGGGVNVVGLEVMSASASVLYSTVTASTFGTTPALGCTTPVAVDLRNSIIVSQGGTPPDELQCAAATVASSATEMTAGTFNLGWFTNYNTGDFSLSATGATVFAEISVWQTGDPPTDIDGDPRPTIDGSPDHAGADVP